MDAQRSGSPAAPVDGEIADLRPTWSRWNEIPTVVFHLPYLKRTLGVAFLIGSLLFAINQLDVVVEGRADWRVWLKGLLTYCVPFCVSNWGILTASRRRIA
jgi:hypothetical protein